MPQPATNNLPHPTRRNWVWLTIQLMLKCLFHPWLRYRCHHKERLPQEGGGLLLVNHLSFLDPLLVGMPLRRPVSFLARDSLFRVPVIGWILRNTYVMPINREAAGPAAIKESIRRMQHGFLVGVFPEGTRSGDGQVGPFKSGFLMLARRAKVPIYPVGISGADRALPRGALWLRPRRVHVVFGTAFSDEELAIVMDRSREADAVALAHERVAECQSEAESRAHPKS